MHAMRVLGAVCALALIAPLPSGCGRDEGRGPQPIVGLSVRTDTELNVDVDTCGGDPEAEVVESDDVIIITVTSTAGSEPGACTDSLVVTLDSDYASRTVIDGATGKAAPWTEG